MSSRGRFGMTYEERIRHRVLCPLLRHRFRDQVEVQLLHLARDMKRVNELKARERACKQKRCDAKKKRR